MCHKSGLQNGEIWKYQIGVAVWKAKIDLSENTDGAKKKCKSCTHVLCCAVLCYLSMHDGPNQRIKIAFSYSKLEWTKNSYVFWRANVSKFVQIM